jgi:hypothetical protein
MIIVRRRVTNKQANFGIGNVLKEPFRRLGKNIAETMRQNANVAAANAVRNPGVKAAQEAATQQAWANWATANPGKIGAVSVAGNAAVLGAGVGAGLAVRSFTRRRRTKNGKIVVERVNRK